MSLGSWDPKAEQAKADFQIDSTQLKRFIDISQQQQLEQLSELLSPTEQQIQSLTEQRNQANDRTQAAQQAIAKLRASEKSFALQDPYGRGNRAAERLNNSLQRITGTTDNDG